MYVLSTTELVPTTCIHTEYILCSVDSILGTYSSTFITKLLNILLALQRRISFTKNFSFLIRPIVKIEDMIE